ncbi:hypothetical protein KIH27_13380 [Mycobacterium sp. M1]|uniref:DUF222 domain-containing protein n=1 Tax=Mycolicibacter acidiphilus TaxID=2835306 RepID=A0ABS5RJW6_9MYCO|nr:hypothetical protein [Mycolicibacter acidiphilus]MBS9534580.1 hypothetical protein [Mycolicibacter acidiphilus]
MHLTTYLRLLDDTGQSLAASYRLVAEGHRLDFDVHYACLGFAGQCENHCGALTSVAERYADVAEPAPDHLRPAGLDCPRSGPIGLLRDLQDVYQLASFLDITWTLVGQAAQAARDRELMAVVARCNQQTTGQLAWLRARMKAEAPQALLVADGSGLRTG